MTFVTRLRFGALAFALLAGIASAHGFMVGSIKIGHPWAGATPPGASVGGAYLSIENLGQNPIRLLGARTPIAQRVEIHEMSMTGGVMRMRPMPGGLIVPPGAKVQLTPGGLHLMLVGLVRPLVEKDKIPMTLLFEGGPEINVELHVQVGPSHEH